MNNDNDKNDRRERFQRRRTNSDLDHDDAHPRRRKTPYKREHTDYRDYLADDEEYEWWQED